MSTILFINGDLSLYQRFCRQLSIRGHNCKAVVDHADVAAMVQENCYDVVVFGIKDSTRDMEYMLEMLKKQKDILVIILGSEKKSEGTIRWLGRGASDYITVDCSPEELEARVDAVIRRRHCANHEDPATGRNESAAISLGFIR